jgi:hypothetical protein
LHGHRHPAADVNYQAATDNLIVNVSLDIQGALVLSASPALLPVGASSILSVSGGSSGGNVIYTLSSGACSLSGNTLSASGAGSCQVSATMGGNTQYTPVTSNTVTVTFTPVDSTGTTPGGQVSAQISGGSCAGFAPGSAQFTMPSTPPPNSNFPYGVFGFTALACGPGGSITITLTYPQALPAGTRYLKYLNGAWVDWTSRVTISGNTVTLTLTNGGEGDTNPNAEEISDPGGPTLSSTPPPPPPNPIPTLGGWAELLMGLLLVWIAERSLRFKAWRRLNS